jgi:hypothetical protein
MKSVKEQLEDIWNQSMIKSPVHLCRWKIINSSYIQAVPDFITVMPGYYTQKQERIQYSRVVFNGHGKRLNPRNPRGIRYDP